MASPLLVVTAPLPVIVTGPVAVDTVVIVPVKPGEFPSTRLPPVPAKSAVNEELPPSERVPPFSITRNPAVFINDATIVNDPSSSSVALGSLKVREFTVTVVPVRIGTV
jgi:hypothetical protein